MAEEEGRTVEDSEPQGEERPPGGEEQPADSDSAGSHGGGDALVEDGAAPGGASSESMPEPDAAQEQPQPYDEEAPGGADTSPAGAPPEAEAAEPPASEEGRRAEAERPPGEALAQEQRTPAEQQQEDESPVQPTVVGDDAPGPDAGPTATEPAAPAAADAPAAPSAPALTVQAPEPTPSDSPARRQTATQSAPVSPARSPGTPMRSRQAAITLKDVMATGDVLLLAKSVVQERAQQRQAYAAMATHRSGKGTGSALAPTIVSKSTPASLVLRPPRGQSLAPPPGWRSSWSATDFQQVLAADRQLQEAEARRLKEERRAFALELSARRQASRSPSPTGRVPSDPSRPSTSPAREHEQRVMANAHERWRQHQEEVERRIKHKEDEARARVQQLQKARVDETTAKSQETDRAVSEALQRAELMHFYRSQVASRGAQDKEQRRTICAQRKEAAVSQGVQNRSAHSLHLSSLAASRNQEQTSSDELNQQLKLKRLEEATRAAAARAAAHHRQQARQIATARQQRFEQAAEKMAERQRQNEAAGQHVLKEWARRQALLQQRQQQQQAREHQLHRKQVVAMVSRHYAEELALMARITNKLPEPPAHVVQSLTALQQLKS